MTETARIHEPEPPVLEPKPALQLVHGTASGEASSEAAMPNFGRTAMIGYVVGFVAATVVITVAGTLGGLGFGASLGLGAFVGIWGGGFGFMMGGTVPLARHLDAQSARSTHHGQGETHGTAAR
ncbi:MAG: hypothetical protein KDB10_08955 [Acidimicrobiales bacterium]|nr:hypothetical protein [Acidimicrobiales bacterium]